MKKETVQSWLVILLSFVLAFLVMVSIDAYRNANTYRPPDPMPVPAAKQLEISVYDYEHLANVLGRPATARVKAATKTAIEDGVVTRAEYGRIVKLDSEDRIRAALVRLTTLTGSKGQKQ